MKTTKEILDFIASIDENLLDEVESRVGDDLVFNQHFIVMTEDGEFWGIMDVNGDYSEPGWNTWINNLDKNFPSCEFDVDKLVYIVNDANRISIKDLPRNYEIGEHDLGYIVHDPERNASAFVQRIDDIGIYAWKGDSNDHDHADQTEFYEAGTKREILELLEEALDEVCK